MTLKIIDNLWKCLEETNEKLKDNPCFDLHSILLIIVNELGVKVSDYSKYDKEEWKQLINNKLEKLLNDEFVSEPFMLKSIVSYISDYMIRYNEVTVRNLQIAISDMEEQNIKKEMLPEAIKRFLDPCITLYAENMYKCWKKNVDKHLNQTVYDLYVSDYGFPIMKQH